MKALVTALYLTLFCAGAASALPPPDADPALAPWFQSLRNPVQDGMSCCAEADGHVLSDNDWRIAGNHYEVKIAGAWHDVPQDAILNRVGNPTGGAVVFYPPGFRNPPIFCFVRPVEG